MKLKTEKEKIGVLVLLLFITFSFFMSTDFVTNCFNGMRGQSFSSSRYDICVKNALQNKETKLKFEGLIALGSIAGLVTYLYSLRVFKNKEKIDGEK